MLQEFDIAASIVTFNTDPVELERLMHSLQQSQLSVHLTVVDNSSTEALRAVVAEAGGQYLHPGKNVGFGAGHNLALRQTLGLATYQLLVNPDVVLAPDTLEHVFQFMQANPEIGQVMPAVCNTDGSEQRLTKRLPTPIDLFVRRFLGGLGMKLAPKFWARYEMRDVDLSTSCDVPSLSGCFMFLRSSVLQQVGLFDERYFLYMEDVDLCRRIGDKSRTVFFPGASLIHGYDKGSYRDPRLTWLHLASAVKYFNKWGWLIDRERRQRNQLAGTARRFNS